MLSFDYTNNRDNFKHCSVIDFSTDNNLAETAFRQQVNQYIQEISMKIGLKEGELARFKIKVAETNTLKSQLV